LLNNFRTFNDEDIIKYCAGLPQTVTGENPPSEREILQHFVAFNQMLVSPRELTEELIFKTHKILMESFTDERKKPIQVGVYRLEQCSAGTHYFFPPEVIPSSMKRLIEQYRENESDPKVDSILLAAWLMSEFVTIHPFSDGNGRMSRLLFNYALQRRKFVPFAIPIGIDSDDKGKYIQSLRKYQQLDRSSKVEWIWGYSVYRIHHCLRDLNIFH